jgi:hypothetical protein
LAALYRPLPISATKAAVISQKTQIGMFELCGVLIAVTAALVASPSLAGSDSSRFWAHCDVTGDRNGAH